jgi:ubiquinone biosynthesis protein
MFSSVCRLIQIVWCGLRFGLDHGRGGHLWVSRAVAIMLCWWPARRRALRTTMGARLRQALVFLGPLFIKFGQALSTRPDVVTPAVASELSLLQSQVPGVPGAWVVQQCCKAWGDIDSHFRSFDEQPLAAASVAQVHAAVRHDGTAVVVKVLRPQIHQIVARDLRCLTKLAAWLDRFWPGARRWKLPEVVAEFARFTQDELDLQREAANASQMRRAFRDSPILSIPFIDWSLSSASILVMQRMHGVPIADIETLRAHGVNMAMLAERGVEIFFTQILRDRFFHADMHPGNILVDVTRPDSPRYIALDFGIVGSLSEYDQRYLAENMLAFFQQDYARVVRLHIQSGWVADNVDALAFENTIRALCEPLFEQPLSHISLASMLLNLFRTAQEFSMQVQPQLILLQKTLLSIEGLGRQLYPELDLWATAQPMIQRWLRQQAGPKAAWQRITQNGPFWWRPYLDLPQQVEQLLAQPKKQNLIKVHQQRGWWRGMAVGMAVMLVMLQFVPLSMSSPTWAVVTSAMALAAVVV